MAPEPLLVAANQATARHAEGLQETGRLLMDLQSRLEVGAFGFIQNPDKEYQDHVGQWELDKFDEQYAPVKMTPVRWATKQAPRHTTDIP